MTNQNEQLMVKQTVELLRRKLRGSKDIKISLDRNKNGDITSKVELRVGKRHFTAKKKDKKGGF